MQCMHFKCRATGRGESAKKIVQMNENPTKRFVKRNGSNETDRLPKDTTTTPGKVFTIYAERRAVSDVNPFPVLFIFIFNALGVSFVVICTLEKTFKYAYVILQHLLCHFATFVLLVAFLHQTDLIW